MRRLSFRYAAMHISPNSNYFLSYHDSQVLFSHFIEEIYIVSFLYSLGAWGYKEPQNFQTQCSHDSQNLAGIETWNCVKSRKHKAADTPSYFEPFLNLQLNLYSGNNCSRSPAFAEAEMSFSLKAQLATTVSVLLVFL